MLVRPTQERSSDCFQRCHPQRASGGRTLPPPQRVRVRCLLLRVVLIKLSAAAGRNGSWWRVCCIISPFVASPFLKREREREMYNNSSQEATGTYTHPITNTHTHTINTRTQTHKLAHRGQMSLYCAPTFKFFIKYWSIYSFYPKQKCLKISINVELSLAAWSVWECNWVWVLQCMYSK